MTALASPVAPRDPYMVAAIDDEMEIARLLGYRKLERPYEGNPSPQIWGRSPDFVPTWPGSEGRGFVPRWRRSSECFGLIARCHMSVLATALSAQASCPGVALVFAQFSDYPTPDDAIRAAMCKAAIAYLTAESSTTKATP